MPKDHYWEKAWDIPPCDTCEKRWPNERCPNEEVGSGCDGLACYHRPDLYDMSEPKEIEE